MSLVFSLPCSLVPLFPVLPHPHPQLPRRHAMASQAQRALRVFAADLAIEHAGKQLTLTPETDRAVINEFIGQFENEVAVDSVVMGGKK